MSKGRSPLFLHSFFKRGQGPVSVRGIRPMRGVIGRFIAKTVSFNTVDGRTRRTLTLTVGGLNTHDGANRKNRSDSHVANACRNVSLYDGAGRVTSKHFKIATRCLIRTRRVRVGITRNTGPKRKKRLPKFGMSRIVTGAHRSVPNVSLVSPPPRRSVCSVRSLTRLVFSLGGMGPRTQVDIGLMTRDNIKAVTTKITGTGTSLVIVSKTRKKANTSPTSDVQCTNVSPRVKLDRARRALILGKLHKRIGLRISKRLGAKQSVVGVTLLNTRRFNFNAATLVMLKYIVVHGYRAGAYPMNITARSPRLHGRFHKRCRCMIGCFAFLTRRMHRCLTRVKFAQLRSVVKQASLVRVRRTPDRGGSSLLSFDELLRQISGKTTVRRIVRRGRSVTRIGSIAVLTTTESTVRGKGRVSLRCAVTGASHSMNTVLTKTITGGCKRTKLPRRAVRVGFGNSTNRDFNTFLARNVDFGLRNRTGSCLKGKLDNKHVTMLPPIHDGFSTRGGAVTKGALLCNTASNRICVGKQINRHFTIHGSNIATIMRNMNSRYYRCVAKKQIIMLKRAKQGFTTKVDNNITCI